MISDEWQKLSEEWGVMSDEKKKNKQSLKILITQLILDSRIYLIPYLISSIFYNNFILDDIILKEKKKKMSKFICTFNKHSGLWPKTAVDSRLTHVMGMSGLEENMKEKGGGNEVSLVSYGKLINFLFFQFSTPQFFILPTKLTHKD